MTQWDGSRRFVELSTHFGDDGFALMLVQHYVYAPRNP